MASYSTPGVYVQEISTLPPSVAEVSTAIPAFIGYTEKFTANSDSVQIGRISGMLDYERQFGLARPHTFKVKAKQSEASGAFSLETVEDTTENNQSFMLYNALLHYFQNGGGTCYVVSIGDYTKPPEKADFTKALQALEKEDEPTLLLAPDATTLDQSSDYYTLCQEMLAQCAKLKDRFAIFDVLDKEKMPVRESVQQFRDGIGMTHLMYGAAYAPHLVTSQTQRYREEDVLVEMPVKDSGTVVSGEKTEASGEKTSTPVDNKVSMASLKTSNTAVYNLLKKELANQLVVLPPSPAVAGVYGRVDAARGIWKAPANEGLSGVLAPSKKINNEEQAQMNIHADGGKSINAIRTFVGKGTLLWGARTLAGNDNEWRYISVRRLFNMLEEASQKATSFAVFEPNTTMTWLKVKSMLDSYLRRLFEQGAFAGSSPETSYFVSVGLGKTMTEQDVLEGRMKVEIGIAASRPAEFIILSFSHMLPGA